MIIELEELFCKNTDQIKIDEDINFPNEYLEGSDIKSIKKAHFNGKILENLDNSIALVGNIDGTMVLCDAISLEDVDYDFSCQVDENLDEFLENNQNSIDIIEFLWQNIVLEVPLKYTLVDDLSKYQGDGWKVVSEDDVKRNNPFSALAEKMKEE